MSWMIENVDGENYDVSDNSCSIVVEIWMESYEVIDSSCNIVNQLPINIYKGLGIISGLHFVLVTLHERFTISIGENK